jgi:hypothetical protein
MTALTLIILTLVLSANQSQSAGSLAKSSGFITEHSAAITLMVTVVGFTGVSFSWLNCWT